MGLRNGSQTIRRGSRHLYPLSHLTCPGSLFIIVKFLPELTFFLSSLFFFIMCMCVGVWVGGWGVNMNAGALGRRAGLGSSGVRVIGSRELLNVGAGSQTQILCKSNMCS